MKEADIIALRKIAKYEAETPEEKLKYGWEWHEVGVMTATINKFVVNGWVRVMYSSTKHKQYLLTDAGKAELEGQPAFSEEARVPEEKPELNTSNLFKYIVGYDNLKELLRESLQLDKPIHVLLWGPPSIAKTLFLLDIERAGGAAAMWLIGSATSRAGLWDAVAERRPKWLLIDELDKMTAVDQSALLSIMERGRIVRTKVRRQLDETINCWVVGTANRISKMPPELLSRFAVYQLGVYTPTEYCEVVKNVLVNQESIDDDSASKIAEKLLNKTNDVRDSIRVARLSTRVGVDRAVELLIRT